ncbi:uncharacterized protein LOC142330886 [Lycorma delicatula]|uniref:uncharacterized protein LOC142330886 n=1 Tax=Lycorma delicatula TaxID=130591 RepID=UPI003F512566
MELAEPYLNCGRTLFTDNFYSSVQLAEKLLDNGTHLVGTLRNNRKFNPAEVINKKLHRRECVASKNSNGVVVLKWKDRRDILMVTAKHTNILVVTNRKTEVLKPAAVVDYNRRKSYVDLSDRLRSYSNPLRRSIK